MRIHIAITMYFFCTIAFQTHAMESNLSLPADAHIQRIYVIACNRLKVAHDYAPCILAYVAQNHPDLLLSWVYHHKKQTLALALLWYIRSCYMTKSEQDRFAQTVFTQYSITANGLNQYTLQKLRNMQERICQTRNYTQHITETMTTLNNALQQQASKIDTALVATQQDSINLYGNTLDILANQFVTTQQDLQKAMKILKDCEQYVSKESEDILQQQEAHREKINQAQQNIYAMFAAEQDTRESLASMLTEETANNTLLGQLLAAKLMPGIHNPVEHAFLPTKERVAHQKKLCSKYNFNKPLALPFQN